MLKHLFIYYIKHIVKKLESSDLFRLFLRHQKTIFWSIFIVLSLSVFYQNFISQISSEHQESQSVLSIKEKRLNHYAKDLNQKTIYSITKHSIFKSSSENVYSIFNAPVEKWVVISLQDGGKYRIRGQDFSNPEILKITYQSVLDQGFIVRDGFNHDPSNPMADFLFRILSFLLLVIILVYAQQRMMGGFMKRDFRLKGKSTLQFSDIIGYDDVKKEVSEVLHQIQYRKDYRAHGLNPPKGILFTGSPGVGKTMFAQALAKEFNAAFFHATGSDFVEMFVGTGPKRIRSLFEQALKEKSAVIFIDEFDALGSRDGRQMDQERLSTINQLLSEMDGLKPQTTILVIAATNYPDRIDKALLRPGRFDKKIEIPLPDCQTRTDLLKHYFQRVHLDSSVDLSSIASSLQSFSPAQIKNLTNQSIQIAIRESLLLKNIVIDTEHFSKNLDLDEIQSLTITNAHIEEALEIILLGISSRDGHEDELVRIAYHELGHALIGHLLNPYSQVKKISIQGRGMALGFAIHEPHSSKSDRFLKTQLELEASIAVYLAGRASEQYFLSHVSSGCADDLEKATQIAYQMVCHYGMSDLGLVSRKPDIHGNYSQEIASQVEKILNHQYEVALKICQQNQAWFSTFVPLLLEKKVLYADDLFGKSSVNIVMP